MDELLLCCTTQKHLVHGDFGFHNTISDGQAITGVLDWADSRLGDFLYDVVTLTFLARVLRAGIYGAGMSRPAG
jgi:aminoglycoside phosphotransferase (APT) family kinase protein